MFLPIYKVTSPQVIEEFVEPLEYDKESVLVHVDKMAICKADIRYYLGKETSTSSKENIRSRRFTKPSGIFSKIRPERIQRATRSF